MAESAATRSSTNASSPSGGEHPSAQRGTRVGYRRLRSRDDPKCAGKAHLAARLEALYQASRGRRIRHDSWNVLYAVFEEVVFAPTDADGWILRSVPEMVRFIAKRHPELVWEVEGRNVRWINTHYGIQVRRAIDLLADIGALTPREAVAAANGRGIGIRFRVAADVAQLAAATSRGRAARRRGDHAQGRSENFLGADCLPPLESSSAPKGASDDLQGSASARGALGTRDGPPRLPEVSAALDAVNDVDERPGVEIVAAVPWIAGVDPALVARVVFGGDPRLSERQRRRFDAACRRLGRYGYCGLDGPAAAVAAALDVASGDWRQWYSRPPKTLGGVAHCVRRLANERRRQERARRVADRG